MRCIIVGSRRSSSTISCQRIHPFQGGTRTSNAYKEYYAVAIGAAPPNPKASIRKTRSNKGTGSIPGVPDVPTDESEEELSWNSIDDEGDDGVGMDGGDDEQDDEEEEYDEETRDEESFDPIPRKPENSDDEGNAEEDLSLNVGRKEGHVKEEEEDELYKDVNINKEGAVKVAIQIQSDRLCDEAQKENDEFLKSIDENMQKIIKEQVKEQVKDKEPSAGPDRGSKRRREGKEPESASAPKEKATRSAGKLTQGTKSQQASASESVIVEEPIKTTFQIEAPSHLEFDTSAEDQPIIRELTKHSGSRSSFDELMDTPLDFSNFLINQLKVDTLTPELLVDPTYELMKGLCKSLVELEYHLEEVFKATTDQLDWVNPEGQRYPHNLLKPLPLIPNNQCRHVISFENFINNDLEYLHGGALSRKYTTSITETKAEDYGHIKWIEDLFYGFSVNRESAIDVYSKRRIIAVTELKIVEWHNYKHLDWITVRRDDDKLYKFKEGNFKRLRIQDLQNKLLLLVQGKLTNLTVEERFALTFLFECLQEASSSRGVWKTFNWNKDKKNRLLRIDELHKFSNGTLTDVRTALDDRLKGIRMQYLPQSIWMKSDKDRAVAMIQAIDKRLKTRRIMRSLERFVGGRVYKGDFRM
nr:hypothetical protein [Tanacetum cinerariifolium]